MKYLSFVGNQQTSNASLAASLCIGSPQPLLSNTPMALAWEVLRDPRNGYLVMEFIKGRLVSQVDPTTLEGQDIIQKCIKGVQHLRTVPRYAWMGPGPICGEPKGIIWSADGAETVFRTMEDM
jgi:hypothetical protein